MTNKPPTLLGEILTHALAGPGLPTTLPPNPLPLLRSWYDEAIKTLGEELGTAMTIATSTPDGHPAARLVLCKGIDIEPPSLLFFTNYESRKGRELIANPNAAACFYWDKLARQARVEGIAERLPNEHNDRYFASRPMIARLGAWVSEQSRPLSSREELLSRVRGVAHRFGLKSLTDESAIPRPAHWGGFRLRAKVVELWVAGRFRLHDRAVWRATRDPGRWECERLCP
ncbi:pyridoxamine 5'-phosphate oxidase [Phycisphaerales bacterium]|nr:pyridoxamine 5'-phosphate oxidase [Phycisphaerales bacterium]